MREVKMKRLFLISLALILAINIFAANSIAMISASKGKVNLRRAAKVVPHKTGDFLYNKDEIRTGGESFAAYKYIDGSSSVKIFSNSIVYITATKNEKILDKKIELDKGSVFTNIKPNTGSFSVATPTTVASVKGTAFFTKFDEFGQSTFIITEGEVELKILNKDTQSITAGNTAVVQANGSFQIHNSTQEELQEIEQAELESTQGKENKKMRIPVIDPNGQTKYIEITW
jgi:hypothetical protein